MEDDINYKFDRILDYEFHEGVLVLKTRYRDDDIGEHDLAVHIPILKRDVPVEVARFIRDKVIEDKRGGYYNTWAKSTLKAHSRGVRRLYHAYRIDSNVSSVPNKASESKSHVQERQNGTRNDE